MKNREMQEWDVFISYASEDGEAVAHPLARRLGELGLRVWMDRTELTVGDHIRRKIDEGLAKCRFGIVILSPHFFAKDYPQRELDGLASREHDGRKVVLPVWYGVDADHIRGVAPMLVDRLAARWDDGLEAVVVDLLRVVDPDRLARLVAGSEESPKKTADAPAPRIASAAELTQMLHHVYGFVFQNDDLDPDDIELVGGFQKELLDWSDIWRDLDPLERANATTHVGDRLKALSGAGWSVYAHVERRQIDGHDSREWPIAVVAVTRAEPTAAFSVDQMIGKATHTDGLRAKTVNGVALLWRSLVDIKDEASTALYFDAIILPEECDDALRGAVGKGPDNVRAMFEACRDKSPLDRPVPAFVSDPNIDATRPFVSQRLWSLYTTIRAVHLRLLILAGWSFDRKQYIDWRDDDIVNEHLRQFFSPEDIEQIKAQRLGAFSNGISPKLEDEFLKEARRILDGKRN
ncbi:toll/interleukin-1 receptor domain-containing protein [Candidatus Palauibacter sp.]|uniref:toll/interleukin-1 receptor domain-containing protein n=1 Tax=Candidatus Palauibacter sp. TaxID=3101350 RepID=UPI003B5B1B3E